MTSLSLSRQGSANLLDFSLTALSTPQTQQTISARMVTITSEKDDINSPPEYGLKVKLNHVYPENRSQNYTPTLRVLWTLLPLILRYIWYYIKYTLTGRSIVMDYVEVQRAKQIYGVPIGGIGCGSIGRGFRGEFCRFQLKPGLYQWNVVEADQFIVTIKDEHKDTIFHSLLSTFANIWHNIKNAMAGRSVPIDSVRRAEQIYGVPIGGIGCGSMGRGFRGEFCRFQLKPGLYEFSVVEADQFIVTVKDEHRDTIFHSLLSTFPKKSLRAWESHLDGTRCHYTGLYPRAWTEYDLSDYGIKLTCRQVSPVIPHEYSDSSLPCAVFVWNAENLSDQERTVTIAFTFKNGTGNRKDDKSSTCNSKSFSYSNSEGVLLYHTINKMRCVYALSVKSDLDLNVSKCLYFDPNSDGQKPWLQLKNNGQFDKIPNSSFGDICGEMACGVASKTTLQPSTSKEMVMSLVWDMPTVRFPASEKKFNRFYTEKFGTEDATLKIVSHAFNSYPTWEQRIYDWQKDVLSDSELPDWYKGALFNETYFISDGGGVWLSLNEREAETLPESDPRRTYGRFAYLEGHEYRMYNSYDVHFYASHALHKNWPHVQKALHYDLRDYVFLELPQKVKMLYNGEYVERKVMNSVPHDAGDPGDVPFQLVNAYPIHDVSNWKDLGPKFVLQSYRDAADSPTGVIDKKYAEDMYDACYTVMNKCFKFDVDGDGLIENSGSPDQTFDTWVMTGASAYCGGLWLAACAAMVAMADVLGKVKDRTLFEETLAKGKKSYESKLWNGLYYNYDCSKEESKAIMADQLCGQWYLRCCGVEEYVIAPKQNIQSALKTIFDNNVMSFCNGNMGAVNGFLNGDIDYFTLQSQEIWTGVTYALAATMIQEGMIEEGFRTAGGMYKSMTEMFGLAFSTPEALYAHKYYRAIGYMRPLSIWSMQIALEQRKKKQSN